MFKRVFLPTLFAATLLQGGIVSETIDHLPQLFIKKTVSHGAEASVEALRLLERKYGERAAEHMTKLRKVFGDDGLALMTRYGDESILASRESYRLVAQYGNRGYYLLHRFPSAPQHFRRFGNSYVEATERFGAEKITRWLDEAAPAGRGESVLKWLDRFGEKGERFLERHWGKLLVTGFVALNADSLITATEQLGESGIHETGVIASNVVNGLLQSRFVDYAGIGLLLYLGALLLFRQKRTARAKVKNEAK